MNILLSIPDIQLKETLGLCTPLFSNPFEPIPTKRVSKDFSCKRCNNTISKGESCVSYRFSLTGQYSYINRYCRDCHPDDFTGADMEENKKLYEIIKVCQKGTLFEAECALRMISPMRSPYSPKELVLNSLMTGNSPETIMHLISLGTSGKNISPSKMESLRTVQRLNGWPLDVYSALLSAGAPPASR